MDTTLRVFLAWYMKDSATLVDRRSERRRISIPVETPDSTPRTYIHVDGAQQPDNYDRGIYILHHAENISDGTKDS